MNEMISSYFVVTRRCNKKCRRQAQDSQSTKQIVGKPSVMIRDNDDWSFMIRQNDLLVFSLNFIGGLLTAYVGL